jgi:hypothetical protein
MKCYHGTGLNEYPTQYSGGRGITWPTTIVLSVFYVGAVAALFVFTRPAFAVARFLTRLE